MLTYPTLQRQDDSNVSLLLLFLGLGEDGKCASLRLDGQVTQRVEHTADEVITFPQIVQKAVK